jgi:hypothetical protein
VQTVNEHPQDPTAATTIDASNRRRLNVTQFGSVMAVTISLLALAVGAYQTRLMQAQARASVWPWLSIGYSVSDAGEKAGFMWQIENNGVGPARVESVTLSFDGKPLRRWAEALGQLYPEGIKGHDTAEINGTVLPPNSNRDTTIEALKILDAAQVKTFLAARDRFKMEICYCSVYDDCWKARWLVHKVQTVEKCETDGTIQFEE